MSSDNPILLSICIPSYNRAEQLPKVIDSIIIQTEFLNGEVEIVISDNCSSDNTEEVLAPYLAQHPDRIRYSRNSSNVGAEVNYEKVLSMARGEFLKLNNDYLLIKNGAITEMMKIIRATMTEKPIIFCTNGSRYTGDMISQCADLNAFIQRVSYHCTWIGGFGIWRQDFEKITDFAANAHLRLVQIEVLFNLLAQGKRAIILYDAYFVGLPLPGKGGYNIAEVFGKNYLSILKRYLAQGLLNNEVFQEEKKNILLNHIIPYYFDTRLQFSRTGFFEHLQDYLQDDYFYQVIEDLIHKSLLPAPQPPVEPAVTLEQQVKNYWRYQNPHNETQLKGAYAPFILSKVTVGRRSYGSLNLSAYGREEEKLTIGSFVSIADNVKFMLGGNHFYDGLSSFPFKAKYFGEIEALTKGPIVVGDDVWIGNDATILSGITIGQGAVIAAGSMVTKDVPPYSIVGGNPARVIKYRFAPEVVEKLCRIDFSVLSDEAIMRSKDMLYEPLTPENVDAVLQLIFGSGKKDD